MYYSFFPGLDFYPKLNILKNYSTNTFYNNPNILSKTALIT